MVSAMIYKKNVPDKYMRKVNLIKLFFTAKIVSYAEARCLEK